MEILSYVLRGTLEHRDSLGNTAKMPAGDVQLMSAGRGIQHSEFNSSDTEGLRFLQMWVIPAEQGTEPRYEQRAFAELAREAGLVLAASPTGEQGSLTLGQDVRFYVGHLTPGRQVELAAAAGRKLWVQVATGELRVGEHTLRAGDGAALEADGAPRALAGVEETDFVVFDLP
jgi:redox-sensitive bicupin YhaK (pirin superfamily)